MIYWKVKNRTQPASVYQEASQTLWASSPQGGLRYRLYTSQVIPELCYSAFIILILYLLKQYGSWVEKGWTDFILLLRYSLYGASFVTKGNLTLYLGVPSCLKYLRTVFTDTPTSTAIVLKLLPCLYKTFISIICSSINIIHQPPYPEDTPLILYQFLSGALYHFTSVANIGKNAQAFNINTIYIIRYISISLLFFYKTRFNRNWSKISTS